MNKIPISTPTNHNSLHSSSFQNTLDNTIDSHDSDSEMVPNPIYYSNSSKDSFTQFFPRVADSPNLSSSPSLDPQNISNSQNEATYTRAPQSPYNLRPLPPPRHYNPTKPNISFPP